MKIERLESAWVRGPSVASGFAPSDSRSGDVEAAGPGVGLPGNGDFEWGAELTRAETEEREVVEWANLKECQSKFLKEGGVDVTIS
jgi:hypothetical protein